MKHFNKVLFIHIPKTGGQSIFSFLDENNMDHWIRGYPRHDPYHLMQKNNDISLDVFSFAVVRNPYTRAYSYYKHFNRQNKLNVSFTKFLIYIKNKKFFKRTPMIQYNQLFYLYDLNGNISLNKLYKFENLNEFEDDFNTKLPTLNVGRYTKKDFYSDYSEKNITLVKEIYNKDFKILNYSNSFDGI